MFRQLIEQSSPAEDPQSAALRVAELLRARRPLPDDHFDRFLPQQLRLASATYWTPLEVVARAAAWLDDAGIRSVVDIGSGAGKFCVAGALAGKCRFTGLEQRPRLVVAGRHLARQFGVQDRVQFVHGVFGEVPTPPAEAYYFFNSFGENLFEQDDRLDDEAELSGERYQRDIELAVAFLRSAPIGTYVLTYNGFGGRLPRDYEELRIDRQLPNTLRLSRKVSKRAPPTRVDDSRERCECNQ